jgi:phenylpropionate dioxygenase-like ring-hydroxylating dioxygenase large terminal subunit
MAVEQTQVHSGLPVGWAVVGPSEDFSRKPVAVRVGDVGLAIYRDPAGSIRALLDQCPHRGLPLSTGRVDSSGALECRFHGWTFDGRTGRCLLAPVGQSAEHRAKVFPATEQDGRVWVMAVRQGRRRQTAREFLHAVGRMMSRTSDGRPG